jgi:TonB family protein
MKLAVVYFFIILLSIPSFAQENKNVTAPWFDHSKGILNFLSKNITYPYHSGKNCSEGTVYVDFTIDTLGRVDNFIIDYPVDSLLDMEVLRVVALTNNKWIPASVKGNKINYQYTIAVKFVLSAEDNAAAILKPNLAKIIIPFRIHSSRLNTNSEEIPLCRSFNNYDEGVFLFERKSYDKAILSFKKAIRTDARDIDALYNCSVACLKIGDPSACGYLKRIKELGSTEGDAILLKYCK